MEAIFSIPFTVLECPHLKLKRPSWLGRPSPMVMFALVLMSYFLVTGGECFLINFALLFWCLFLACKRGSNSRRHLHFPSYLPEQNAKCGSHINSYSWLRRWKKGYSWDKTEKMWIYISQTHLCVCHGHKKKPFFFFLLFFFANSPPPTGQDFDWKIFSNRRCVRSLALLHGWQVWEHSTCAHLWFQFRPTLETPSGAKRDTTAALERVLIIDLHLCLFRDHLRRHRWTAEYRLHNRRAGQLQTGGWLSNVKGFWKNFFSCLDTM